MCNDVGGDNSSQFGSSGSAFVLSETAVVLDGSLELLSSLLDFGILRNDVGGDDSSQFGSLDPMEDNESSERSRFGRDCGCNRLAFGDMVGVYSV